jgi:hypothetical protein
MDTSSVDPPLFPSLSLTAIPLKMERSYFLRGQKMISEPEARDGGTKLREFG